MSNIDRQALDNQWHQLLAAARLARPGFEPPWVLFAGSTARDGRWPWQIRHRDGVQVLCTLGYTRRDALHSMASITTGFIMLRE